MLKKKVLSIVLAVLLILGLSCVSMAAAPSYSYFRNYIGSASIPGNIGSAKQVSSAKSTKSIAGTYIKASASTYASFKAYQKADLGSGSKKEVSPEVNVTNNTQKWLGFYSGYSSVANKNIYLMVESKSATLSDSLTGYWYR